ncbi:MAG: HlyD family efflux transporter periplasmic adaptor subunit [Acidobacteriota bacterium]|nr:HlyD family efflux transporter periplasmic adaptor subunit [Blastocatellia bacterium]MDW8412702.1 HlyD family efflux transporter periplasmic adaptor subunit [Acidobacteriota bacterium]
MAKNLEYRVIKVSPKSTVYEPVIRRRGAIVVRRGLLPQRVELSDERLQEVGWKRVFAIFLVAIVVATSVYYFKELARTTSYPVTSGQLAATVFTATIRPASEIKLAAIEQSVVRQVHVEVGDRVTSGQLLITLDSTIAQPGLAEAELERQTAAVELAEAESAFAANSGRLATLKQELAAINSSVSLAERKAEQVPLRQRQDSLERVQAVYEQALARYRRAESLRSSGLVSEQEFEAAQAELKLAQADLEAARKAVVAGQELLEAQQRQALIQTELEIRQQQVLLVQMRSRLEQARLRLQRAEEAVKQAKARLAQKELRAEKPAVVVEIPVGVGDLVAAGMPLIRLAEMDKLIARLEVDARMVNMLSEGQRASVLLPVNVQVDGKIRSISPVPSENLTHTVDIVFENATGKLLVGQPAKVRFDK